jgi:hypothetical protein
MKIMKELLPEEAYVDELLRWLSRWDTEYSKFADPKVQILVALEEHKSPLIREQVERFLQDVNETARFHAISTLLAQDDAASAGPLASLLATEESVRIRNRIADGLASRGWSVPAEVVESVRRALPNVYTVDAAGHVRRRQP